MAVSSAEGVFWRGSAQSDWQPADPGLPKDEVSAMAMDSGRLFVALRTQGLWMSNNLPVAVRPQAAGSPLNAPVILVAADGNPRFRIRLSQPARIRLSLHAATGRAMASVESKLPPGIQELRPGFSGHGAVFYRLEIKAEDRSGDVRIFRGRVP